MKTLFTMTTLASMVFTGIASCKLFQNAHYDVSALLTVSSLMSVILCVTVVNSKKVILN